MNYGRLACLALSFLVICGGGFASGQAAESGTAVYKMGDAEIIAVRDAVSERGRELLIGDAERIKKLMPAEKSAGASNVYVVKMEKSIILIDTGWGAPRGQALANLAKLGVTPDKIDIILFTHLHGDHVSGLLSEGKNIFPNARLCVAAAEQDYWFNDAEMNKYADKSRFAVARQGISAYGDRVRTFEPGTAIMPGITAVSLYGHTPGHVGYLIESGNKKLLIWGDLTHFTEVQTAAPEIAVVYDVDPKKAVASRQAVLDWVAGEGIFVAGMHITHPGVGKIRAKGDGGYVFEPVGKLE